MDAHNRTLATLEEIQGNLECLKADLFDDGFEEYADTLQDSIARLINLHYVLTNKTDPILGDD